MKFHPGGVQKEANLPDTPCPKPRGRARVVRRSRRRRFGSERSGGSEKGNFPRNAELRLQVHEQWAVSSRTGTRQRGRWGDEDVAHLQKELRVTRRNERGEAVLDWMHVQLLTRDELAPVVGSDSSWDSTGGLPERFISYFIIETSFLLFVQFLFVIYITFNQLKLCLLESFLYYNIFYLICSYPSIY